MRPTVARSLALQHSREARQVGLEPVLLRVAVRRQAEVVDHGVDVVFQLRHFAAGLDLNRIASSRLWSAAVATSAMARTWLVRLSARRLTLPVRSFHVPERAGHVCLTAETAFDADLACHRRYLIRKRGRRFSSCC